MKVCIFSDVHWTTTSSMVRKRSEKYSLKLEYLINSMNWVNTTAKEQNCDIMICAGDFFNKSVLTDEEITALKDIYWNDLECYFLCGNHESSVSDLSYSSLKALESKNHYIISEQCWSMKDNKTQIHFVPYIVESDRHELEYYLDKEEDCDKHIVISHNDIAGINYGGFESKSGFSIKEIEENCDLYLNGHLHNTEWVSKKILNVGSFSAHNFTNDSFRYKYGLWIVDTDTLKVEFFENPFGINFYKIDIEKNDDLLKLNTIKNNSVISVRCNETFYEKCKELLCEISDKIIEQRVTIIKSYSKEEVVADIADLRGKDHIERLIEFCHKTIENSTILDEELAELCK